MKQGNVSPKKIRKDTVTGSQALVITENPRCRVEVEIEPGRMIFRPVGSINEDLNFGKILIDIDEVLSASKPVSFDMGQVTKINSCGVREWLLFLERVQAKVPVDFSMVGETFVEQASVVPNLLGKRGTRVQAFEAPYFCATCKNREIRVLKPEAVVVSADDGLGVPPQKCAKCGSAMDFDGLEEEYFSFLNRAN